MRIQLLGGLPRNPMGEFSAVDLLLTLIVSFLGEYRCSSLLGGGDEGSLVKL